MMKPRCAYLFLFLQVIQGHRNKDGLNFNLKSIRQNIIGKFQRYSIIHQNNTLPPTEILFWLCTRKQKNTVEVAMIFFLLRVKVREVAKPRQEEKMRSTQTFNRFMGVCLCNINEETQRKIPHRERGMVIFLCSPTQMFVTSAAKTFWNDSSLRSRYDGQECSVCKMISKRSLFHKQGDVWIFSPWNKCLLSNILRRNKRQLFRPHPSQNYNSITHTWWRGIGSECGLQCVLSGSQGWAWSPQHLPKEQKQPNIWTTCKESEHPLPRFDTREVHINPEQQYMLQMTKRSSIGVY